MVNFVYEYDFYFILWQPTGYELGYLNEHCNREAESIYRNRTSILTHSDPICP